LDEITKRTETTFYPSKNKNIAFERTKNDFYKFNSITHKLEKKKKDNIPIVFPFNPMRETKCLSLSEKSRFEKLTKVFSDLKYFIENDEENEKELVKEVKINN